MSKNQVVEILKRNDFQFPVATDLDYYGSEATDEDVESYEEFAAEYLSSLTGETVETTSVSRYDRSDNDMYELRQEVWEEYCRQ